MSAGQWNTSCELCMLMEVRKSAGVQSGEGL